MIFQISNLRDGCVAYGSRFMSTIAEASGLIEIKPEAEIWSFSVSVLSPNGNAPALTENPACPI
jgi:hypothetical protein